LTKIFSNQKSAKSAKKHQQTAISKSAIIDKLGSELIF
jgi:hypothetical protein